ncbi:hypothetical protein OJF2_42160 [Aquisphaera giovannonii]|uniref:RNA polymerase sigma factor n=1 Tax=Aquisphaera giovannonii TaxID=406548 RepID=A0A5B9W6Q4_9BACT|nr:sigma-70 family RNA polymerase sigma factor [Aquisphaera giovannonii]QEH35661.1 hypothetical protein OJF2_42160 [Aquisphaera giovannonii]
MAEDPRTELRALLQKHFPRIRMRDPAARELLLSGLSALMPDLVRPSFHRKFPRLRAFLQTDDVTQEVMCKLMGPVFETPPETEEHFRAIVWLVISHTLVNLVRKYYGPEGDGRHFEAAFAEPTDPATTDGRAVRDARLDIPEILAGLPEADAELIVAHYFLGREIQEIADSRGEHRATTSRHHMRILRQLGTRLGA